MNNEPTEIVVGDSLEWSVSLTDYPAPEWVLHYAFFNASNNFTVDADADGADHKVVLAASDTAAYTPGRYDRVAYVTKGADERKSLYEDTVIIKADPAAGSNRDGRQHAQKMLDAIEAVLENRATADELDLVRGQFGERAVERNTDKLMEWRDKYRIELDADEDARDMANGQVKPKGIKVKFTG